MNVPMMEKGFLRREIENKKHDELFNTPLGIRILKLRNIIDLKEFNRLLKLAAKSSKNQPEMIKELDEFYEYLHKIRPFVEALASKSDDDLYFDYSPEFDKRDLDEKDKWIQDNALFVQYGDNGKILFYNLLGEKLDNISMVGFDRDKITENTGKVMLAYKRKGVLGSKEKVEEIREVDIWLKLEKVDKKGDYLALIKGNKILARINIDQEKTLKEIIDQFRDK